MPCSVSAMKWSSSCWSKAPCPSQPYKTLLPSKSRPSTKGTRSEKLFEIGKISSWSTSSWEKMLPPSKCELWTSCSHSRASGWEGARGGSGQQEEPQEHQKETILIPVPVSPPASAHQACGALQLQGRIKAQALFGGCCSRFAPHVPTQGQATATATEARSGGQEHTYRKLHRDKCSSSFLSCPSTGNRHQYLAYFTRSV